MAHDEQANFNRLTQSCRDALATRIGIGDITSDTCRLVIWVANELDRLIAENAALLAVLTCPSPSGPGDETTTGMIRDEHGTKWVAFKSRAEAEVAVLEAARKFLGRSGEPAR